MKTNQRTSGYAASCLNLRISIQHTHEARRRIRKNTGSNDALAILAIGNIRRYAKKQEWRKTRRLGDMPTSCGRSSILRKSKPFAGHTAALFYLIAAYSPHDERPDNLAKRIARSRNETQINKCFPAAEELILRDLEEFDLPHGQSLRDTYHPSDVFLDKDGRRCALAIRITVCRTDLWEHFSYANTRRICNVSRKSSGFAIGRIGSAGGSRHFTR